MVSVSTRVSNRGRIQHTGGKRAGRKIWPSVNALGYPKVELSIGHIFVHTLVNALFNDPDLKDWSPGATTDHKNRSRSDNRASNLEWATAVVQTANRDANASACGNKKRQIEPWTIPGETWRVVPQTQGLTCVSNMGRVQIDVGSEHAAIRYTPLPQPKGDGRCYVNLSGTTRQIGNWMLRAFVRAPVDGESVDHFPDRNPQNNNLANLRWATREEQAKNRSTYKQRSGSRLYEIRRVGTLEWIPVDTSTARKEHGLNSMELSRTGDPKHHGKRTLPGRLGRYQVRYAPDPDQDDLPDEEWVTIVASEWVDGGKYACVRDKGRG